MTYFSKSRLFFTSSPSPEHCCPETAAQKTRPPGWMAEMLSKHLRSVLISARPLSSLGHTDCALDNLAQKAGLSKWEGRLKRTQLGQEIEIPGH